MLNNGLTKHAKHGYEKLGFSKYKTQKAVLLGV